MIQKNEGTVDRIVRVIIGIAALAGGAFFLTGTLQIVAYVVGAAAVITGAIGYCGLYSLLGISTCPMKK